MWGQPPSAVRGAKLHCRVSSWRQCKRIQKCLLPQPRIIGPVSNQSPPNRILQQVLDFGIQVLRTSQDMVERLGLPHAAFSV